MLPTKKKGSKLCITVTKDGVTVYGNKIGFESLSEWLSWIAKADESDHFECHVKMSLMDDDCIFEGKKPKNISVLTDKELAHQFSEESETHPGFELTFMGVTDYELDEMEQHQKTGLLPDGWGTLSGE